MLNRARLYWRQWCLACLLGAGLAPGAAQPAGEGADNALAGKHILVLSPFTFGRPGIDAFTRSYIETLSAGGVNSENVAVEFLALNRQISPAARALTRARVLAQHGGAPIDLIVALQQPALNFALDELAELAPGAPILGVNASADPARASASHPMLLHTTMLDFKGTLDQALALFPRTRQVLVAVGAAEGDQAAKHQVEQVARGYAGRLRFDYTDGLTLAAMRARSAALGSDAIVLLVSVNRDLAGNVTAAQGQLDAMARVASVPSFQLFSLGLGNSAPAVGGSVASIEQVAAKLAGTSLALLRGSQKVVPGITRLDAQPVPMYDWQRLLHWGADPARLPPDTVFLNRPPGLWQEHRQLVQATLLVFALLTALVALLLVQRRRLARAEARSRESEARFRVLVENAPEAIVVFDAEQTRVVDVNSKAEKLFRAARARLLTMRPQDFYESQQPDGLPLELTVARHIERSLAGEELVFERTVRDCDGRVFPCEVSLVRLPAVGRPLLRAGYVDISERKRAELELRQHRNHLEELVAERTSALSIAVREAQAANRAKSVFLANMSHELRTPLNSVIGFSQMMVDSSRLAEEERRNLAIINRSGHHLLSLINDILELSKIEAGRVSMQLAPLSPLALLRDVLEMVKVRAAQAGCRLLLDYGGLPAAVLADGAKLRQVLLNLLSNAVKFAAGGQVTLSLRGQASGANSVALSFAVRDTGIGIASADLERIFEPFVQADTPSTQAGTGLGLTISREFVRLMGASLQVRSMPGEGAEFFFSVDVELCALAAPAAAAARVSALPLAEQGKTVMVVDDNDDCRNLVQELLAPLGFRLLAARDGAAALRMAAQEPVDLLLMDWRMPGQDGLAVTRTLRARAQGPQPRIVMLTASAYEEERTEALAAGADDFLRKPFESEQLFAVLEQQLGLHFERREVMHEGPAPAAATLGAGELDTLDETARADLMRAVRELDLARAEAVLATLAPQQAHLVAAIRAMLGLHQYQALWQALQAPSTSGEERA